MKERENKIRREEEKKQQEQAPCDEEDMGTMKLTGIRDGQDIGWRDGKYVMGRGAVGRKGCGEKMRDGRKDEGYLVMMWSGKIMKYL